MLASKATDNCGPTVYAMDIVHCTVFTHCARAVIIILLYLQGTGGIECLDKNCYYPYFKAIVDTFVAAGYERNVRHYL